MNAGRALGLVQAWQRTAETQHPPVPSRSDIVEGNSALKLP